MQGGGKKLLLGCAQVEFEFLLLALAGGSSVLRFSASIGAIFPSLYFRRGPAPS